MKWSDLQDQHKEWVDREYPDQPTAVPAAGCVEEAGELLHAVLKIKQAELWGSEGRYPSPALVADLEDAVGDCALYFCSLCSTVGWNLDAMMSLRKMERPTGEPLHMCVNFVRVAAELYDDVCVRNGMAYTDNLRAVTEAMGLDLYKCVESSWAVVRRRSRGRSERSRTRVCLCGSTKFTDAFHRANALETLKGAIVMTVGVFSRCVSDEEKRKLDALHLDKIDAADEVLVLDMPYPACTVCFHYQAVLDNAQPVVCERCGELARFSPRPYIGDSTRNEILHATATGKRVRYWSKEGYGCM